MQFWNELEGQEIEGLYPLRRLVRSEGRSAWFETETGEPHNLPATISLTEALTDADEVVARLHAAQNLANPNLVVVNAATQQIIAQNNGWTTGDTTSLTLWLRRWSGPSRPFTSRECPTVTWKLPASSRPARR